MSTINFKDQEKEAQKINQFSSIRIIRKARRKRVTKQIRLIKELYEKVSEQAVGEGKTLSKTIEHICRWFFKNLN